MELTTWNTRRSAVRAAVRAALTLCAAMAVTGAAWAEPSTTDQQDVLSFSNFMPTGGNSRLTRTSDTLSVAIEATGLIPGAAYTLWWVVFNNPAGCIIAGECGGDDIPASIGSAGIAVGNATGNIARGDGTTEFGATLRQNDASGEHQVLFGAGGMGNMVLTASGDDAEVHFVIQSHGRARGGHPLFEQLSYFEANCTPACEDVQFAVHRP